jgi:hypothetical protein
MSTPNLRAEIILIAREWAKQYGIGEDKARVPVESHLASGREGAIFRT